MGRREGGKKRRKVGPQLKEEEKMERRVRLRTIITTLH